MQCRTIAGSFTSQACPEEEMDDTSLLLERLTQAKTTHDMHVALADFMHILGVERFSYVAPNPTNSPHRSWFVTSYDEEWISHYTKQNYIKSDPLYRRAQISQLPVSYSATAGGEPNNSIEKEILHLANDFGMGHWLAAPVHGFGGEFAGLFAAFPRSIKPQDLPNKNLFFLGALYFHHALWNRLSEETATPAKRLSEQQVEILAWAAAGKSKWDISETLDLPQDTVRQEVAAAGHALGTFNLTSTIARAYALGYLKQ